MKLSDLGPKSAVIHYNKSFGSKIPSDQELQEFIDKEIELIRNQLPALNTGEIEYVRGLWNDVSTRSRKVRFAGKHLITFLDFTASTKQTPFSFDENALKAFLRYLTAIETIVVTNDKNLTREQPKVISENKSTSKIKGVTVAAFFKHLSTSKIYPRGREESVLDYCIRINKYFKLPIKDRIKTDFSANENRFESIRLEILPTILDSTLREELVKFFDGIQP